MTITTFPIGAIIYTNYIIDIYIQGQEVQLLDHDLHMQHNGICNGVWCHSVG